MAATLQQNEAIPESYPAAPGGLSVEAASLDAATIWQRIEAYIPRRYTTRQVVWIVEGPGEWVAPLAPATMTSAEVWRNEAWEALTLPLSPMAGYMLPGEGPYRITADVGVGPVPAAVNEAFRRLAEYCADIRDAAVTRDTAGVSKHDFSIGQLSESVTRSQAWAARAMENSGAGDLLRPYRRTA